MEGENYHHVTTIICAVAVNLHAKYYVADRHIAAGSPWFLSSLFQRLFIRSPFSSPYFHIIARLTAIRSGEKKENKIGNLCTGRSSLVRPVILVTPNSGLAESDIVTVPQKTRRLALDLLY